MPVDNRHAKYQEMAPRVRRCRDVVTGRDAMIAGGEAYVPKPEGMEAKEFERYVARGHWYGATKKTVDAMTGLIFRKDPEINLPEAFKAYTDSVTADGISIREVADKSVEEILEGCRVGILVDFPPVEESIARTVARAEEDGDRPFLALYVSETIINWNYRLVRNRRVLSRVILEEQTLTPDPEDEFELVEGVQYRELGLDDVGFYYQRIWVPNDDGDEFIPGPVFYPQRRGLPMDWIPFYSIAEGGENIEETRPALLDLVDANIAHWRNSVDYEHGLHFTANPMPVITGWDDYEDEEVTIGSERALVLTNADAQAFYMEFAGTGLAAIKEAMNDKVRQMAALGTRLLMEDTRGVEAAETAAIHRAGENSVLGSIATSVSTVLTRAIADLVDWAGGNPADVGIQLNTDFLPFALEPAAVMAQLQLYLEGVISKRTLYQRLQEGEMIPPGIDFDEEKERLEEEGMNDLPRADPNAVDE